LSIWLTLYFLKHDPELIERRLAAGPVAEKERTRKIIMTAAFAGFILLFAFPGIDHLFRWSTVPSVVVVLADLGLVLGYLVIFRVFKENSYASATIEIGAQQTVISTGPYSLVRHPMYAGALLMFVCTPLALGPYWALLIFAAIFPVLVWRLIDEERFLSRNLPGYTEYCQRVRYRLIPLIW
jgi:protein-S-isoprenylcysteine O-methyltransferase Ste14